MELDGLGSSAPIQLIELTLLFEGLRIRWPWSVPRRLSAIPAADVVGFSRMTEQDEAATLTVLNTRHRDVLLPPVSLQQRQISNSSDP